MRFPLLTRLTIENYSSVEKCSVSLRELNFLVGPNGSGKSNFIDAFAFVAEALSTSLSAAMRKRGGMAFIPHDKGKITDAFGFRLDFQLSDASNGHYSVRFKSGEKYTYSVEQEECLVISESHKTARFLVQAGTILECTGLIVEKPVVSDNRLFLPIASSIPVFQPVYNLLSRMMVYDPDPVRMQQPRPPGDDSVLLGEGLNFADVFARLKEDHPERIETVLAYMRQVHPLILDLETRVIEDGGFRWFIFLEHFAEKIRGIRANEASLGTLRSLAILIALFQSTYEAASLVCIEEPETGLHPYASGAIRDALREASGLRQIIVSSHSPDLLDDKDISSDSILAVTSRNGSTEIGPLDAGTRSLLQDRLYTAGELLRQNHLKPDIKSPEQETTEAALLFDEF